MAGWCFLNNRGFIALGFFAEGLGMASILFAGISRHSNLRLSQL
jgi:hypothetical protein